MFHVEHPAVAAQSAATQRPAGARQRTPSRAYKSVAGCGCGPRHGRASPGSNFLRQKGFQDVPLEAARTAEELVFGFGHAQSGFQFDLDQFDRADEVGQLEQLVSLRADGLGEFDGNGEIRSEHPVQEFRDGGLAAVVVDLDPVDGVRRQNAVRKKACQSPFQVGDDLVRGRDVVLVDDQATVPELGFAGERHHPEEDAVAELPIQIGVSLLFADERARVEAVARKTHARPIGIKGRHERTNDERLVVENHAEDVETRRRIRVEETTGFVDKYAEDSFLHRPIQKQKRRNSRPAASGEGLPPRLDDPPLRLRSASFSYNLIRKSSEK